MIFGFECDIDECMSGQDGIVDLHDHDAGVTMHSVTMSPKATRALCSCTVLMIIGVDNVLLIPTAVII